jgi:exosortase/archaeosortase family protein
VEVANVCSGASYLVAIITLGLPLAYLTLTSWVSRVTLMGVTRAIGGVANWVHVAFIAIWAYYRDAILHGPFHTLQWMSVAWANGLRRSLTVRYYNQHHGLRPRNY